MTQNKGPTEDLRVRRTRKLLMQAMIELTIAKGFSRITVQEIVERAMVNRATFYRHYLDKYDLLEQYMNDVYALTAAQEELPAAQTPGTGNPPVGLVDMFEHIGRHADFYRVMLGAKGDPAFVQRVQQYSEMRLRSLLPSTGVQTKPNDPPLDLCLAYLAHAGVGGMAWWLKEGTAHSPTQIAVWLNQLNQATIERVLGDVGESQS